LSTDLCHVSMRRSCLFLVSFEQCAVRSRAWPFLLSSKYNLLHTIRACLLNNKSWSSWTYCIGYQCRWSANLLATPLPYRVARLAGEAQLTAQI
jgi:hypothetical protein